MDSVRFFYSTDGTDVHGPVTREALLILVQNKAIGAGSLLCREGESEWIPLSPEDFQPVAAPRLQPYEPAPFVPTAEAMEVLHGAEPTWEERSSLPDILKWVYIVAGIGGTLAIYFVGKSLLPSDQQNIFVYLCVFIVAFLWTWGLPALFTLFIRGPIGHGLRLATTVALTAASVWGLLHADKNILQPADPAIASGDSTSMVLPAQPVETSASAPAPAAPARELQPLEDQAIGNGPTARAARDMITVTNQFSDNVKASVAAENACNFNMSTITGTDDIDQRREATKKLRDSQQDVVEYLQDFDNHCKSAMAHNSFLSDFVAEIIAGARKTGHVDDLIVLWKAKIKLTDDHLAQLDYLEKNYGSWNIKEGKVVFTDNDELVAYTGYLQALQNDFQEITSIQQKITR